MSLFIVSSDWRFKEKFKSHFAAAFLREFSLAEKALVALQSEEPVLLIVDNRLGNGSYQWFLQTLSDRNSTTPIILCLEKDQAEPVLAKNNLKCYCVKRTQINYVKLFEHLDALQEKEAVREKASYHPSDLIGESECMYAVREQLKRYAQEDCAVHLYGETGTGKEIAANYIHRLKYPHKNIVAVNCSLLNSTLGSSMFFGHAKGAFTDGKAELPGLVQEAHQSTLFLDEVENLSLQFQSHLLRLLETGKYRRYGDIQIHTSDFRLVTASNEKLSELIHQNVMRRDFLYRIADTYIHMPSLCEHREDIPLLCEHYLKINSLEKEISFESLKQLKSYDWPGNVRQLFSTLRRSVIMSGEQRVLQFSDENFALS
jgi:two-component system NtrC family response regulator